MNEAVARTISVGETSNRHIVFIFSIVNETNAWWCGLTSHNQYKRQDNDGYTTITHGDQRLYDHHGVLWS
jgi:hypothetical protein